jgi:hypothetical protein
VGAKYLNFLEVSGKTLGKYPRSVTIITDLPQMLSDFVKEIYEESGSIFSRLIEYNSFV